MLQLMQLRSFGCRDESVAERVRPDGRADAGAASDPADHPGGAVPVQPAAIRSQEDRPVAAFADGQVDRPRRARRQRDADDLAALRAIVTVRWPRSVPSASMLAPVASETRRPFTPPPDISARSAP